MHEAAVLDDPDEGAFDNPAALDEYEAGLSGVLLDDLDDNVGLLFRPMDEAPGVASRRQMPSRRTDSGIVSASTRPLRSVT